MLTDEQLRLRKGKITASRVAALMTGDAEKIYRLWQEMIGEVEPENLDHVWAVRLGEATEALNLEWYESKNGRLSRHGHVITHPKHEWAACTLDAWITDLNCPIEVKCVGGREPLEIVIARYQPQMQFQMECTGSDQCAISVIIAGNEPVVDWVERDPVYAAEMMKRGEQFMQSVWKCIPPVILPPAAPPVEAKKEYQMDDNPIWKAQADRWRQSFGAAQIAKESEKILKSLVPDDAKKCFGSGVRITRDRAGRLSLREDAP